MRSLAEHVHHHLIAECPECRAAWEALGEGRQAILEMLGGELEAGGWSAAPAPDGRTTPSGPAAGAARGGSPYGTAFGGAIRRLDDEAVHLRARRRRAERELRALLKVPAPERRQRVLNARTRYRSRAFAERLLEEARRQVRIDPREAADLAELVPLVVLWTPGALPSPWGDELIVRARAWQANALRVAGDLHRADHAFAILRREVAGQALDEDVAGELDSLEASLRIDQGRFAEARERLDQAAHRLARSRNDVEWANVLIKKAELHRVMGRPEQALAESRRASEVLDRQEHAVSYLCALGTQVLALCDLDRPQEARHLMAASTSDWNRQPESWSSLRRRMIEGRIHFGLEETSQAEHCFRAVLEFCRDHGLAYEAAVAALDLAMVHLSRGCTAEVRRLAAEAAPIFHKEMHRELLVALAMFQRAAAAETLTLASARRLRDFIERNHRHSHPAAGS